MYQKNIMVDQSGRTPLMKAIIGNNDYKEVQDLISSSTLSNLMEQDNQ